MKRIVLGLAAALALGGCRTATPDAPASAGPPPMNYKAAAIDYARSAFYDPYSIRDASISQPLYGRNVATAGMLVARNGWIVCLRANSKNRFGGYIGQKYTVLFFEGDQVAFTVNSPEYEFQANELCSGASFEPFPEIENLG